MVTTKRAVLMENQKVFFACETAGCSYSPIAAENDEISPSNIININNNNNKIIMKRKSAASPVLDCAASAALVVSPSKFCSVVNKKVKNSDNGQTSGAGEKLEPKIDSWLKESQMFSNNEKNLALTLLIKKFCNTSQRRLIKTIVEPFFQKDFSNPEVIPKEMVMKILSYLSCKDLLNVSSTCRSLRQSAEDWSLWKEKCPDWLDWLKVENFSSAANQYHHSSCVLTPTTPYAASSLQQQIPKLSERCPPKAAYLRRQRINANWRSARPRRQIVLRGHDDHVITCLQICNDDIIVSGSDDNTLKVWSVTNGQCLHTLVGHTGGVWCSQELRPVTPFLRAGSSRLVKSFREGVSKRLRNTFFDQKVVRTRS
uniref:F-box domain-containing protein n=1 Tax=Romanomermis culicivorax TaxID=13658 RepID=A0A915JMD9_ROMCU